MALIMVVEQDITNKEVITMKLKYFLLLVCFVWQFFIPFNVLIANGDKVQNSVKNIFENSYKQWRKYCDSIKSSSIAMLRFKSPHYEKIVSLGPPVLPYVIEKTQEDTNFHWIHWVCSDIAKVVKDPSISPWAKESTRDWWEGGQKQVNERFDSTYSEWKKQVNQGDSLQAERTRKTIWALGIATLPRMIDKLHDGDYDVLPLIQDMTNNEVEIRGETCEEQVENWLIWWINNKEKWLIPFSDQELPEE